MFIFSIFFILCFFFFLLFFFFKFRNLFVKTGYELINIKLHFFFLGFFNKFLNIKDADIFSCFIFFTRIVLRAIPITILTNIGKISSKWMLPITAYQYFANF